MARLDSSGSPRILGQEGVRTARLMIYLLLAVVFMALDQRGQFIPRARSTLGIAVEPLFHVIDWPSLAMQSISQRLRSQRSLREENERQRKLLLEQAGAVQGLFALRQENERLRRLLGASASLQFDFVFAEMVQVDLNPMSHKVVIDKGEGDGVFSGQAVIDGSGVMGQIEEVSLHMSTVRLLSDPDHAIPVQLVRTGQRTVAFGTGSTVSLLLPNVPLESDIREGDLLVTSGLGDRFPSGFPVAEVAAIERVEGERFAQVSARPLAALDRGREVLLVVPVAVPEPVYDESGQPAGDESGQPAGEQQ